MSPNSSGNRDLADICSYDIVNGRRLTTEEKQRLVAASFGSGVSVREFATRQGIGYSTLNKWRRQYGRLADGSPTFVQVALTGLRIVLLIARKMSLCLSQLMRPGLPGSSFPCPMAAVLKCAKRSRRAR
jgi:hypothetical protein